MPTILMENWRRPSRNALFQFAVLYVALNWVFEFQFDVALILYVAAAATWLRPHRRTTIIAAASALTFLLSDFQFSFSPHFLPGVRDYHNAFYAWINKSGRYLTGFSTLDAIAIRATLFAVIFGLITLCSRVERLRAMFSGLWFWVLLHTAILFALTRQGGAGAPVPVLAVAAVIAFGHFVLIAPFAFRNMREARPGAAAVVANITPPWSRGFIRCWDDTLSPEIEPQRIAELRASGTRYLVFLSVWYLGITAFFEWLGRLPPGRSVVSFLDAGLPGAMYLYDSRARLWMSIFFIQLGLIGVDLLCTIGPFTAIARFFGVAAMRPVYRPAETVSFSDYMVRIFHYYNRFLTEEFFYPVYDRLRFLRGSFALRKWVAVLVTVVLGGLTFHVIKDSFAVLGRGHLAVFRMYTEGLLPYLLLLAVASAIPTTPLARRNRPFRRAQAVCIIGIYSLLLIFTYGFKQSQESLDSRISFLRHLLGL